MDTTPNLALPYILASQAQKHVIHNEAIRALDALVQISVKDRDLTAPPVTPAEGDRYIIASGATGAWSGHDGEIAAWQDAAWMFYAPLAGWIVWVADEAALLAHDGTGWAPALQNVTTLGINASADTTNRLALAAAASLFSHAGAGHQIKVNKAAAGDTASQVFQTAFSGRAELGLAGDDDFHLKVSPDGSTWHEAIVIDKDTGNVGLGTDAPAVRMTVNTNTVSPQPTVLSGAIAHFAGADALPARVLQDAHGGPGEWIFRRSDGTAASPSAISGVRTLGGFGAIGYGTSGYSAGVRAYVEFRSGAAWTDADQSTSLHIYTTPVGATALAERLRVLPDGRIRVGADGAAVCKFDVDGPVRVKTYTVATVPSAAAGAGQIIFVSNESGGAVLAFSDGSNWRRSTDRAVIS